MEFRVKSVVILMAYLAVEPSYAACKRSLEGLYVTDRPESLRGTIDGRRIFYKQKDLASTWAKDKAEFTDVEGKGEKLVINGLLVMHEAEERYMQKLGAIVTAHGGNVLNVGAGLNLVDTAIESHREERRVREHHIIELNEDVMSRAERWREKQEAKDEIYLHLGSWESVLTEMRHKGLKFSGVIYDAFPLKEQDLHRDVIPFLEKLLELQLLEENGIITFYMDSKDGFGNNFSEWVRELGIQQLSAEKVSFEGNEDTDQYWQGDFFAPKLMGVRYENRSEFLDR